MGSLAQTPKLPIFQFGGENSNPGTSWWSETCDGVRRALEEFGCFVAVYDRVSPELDGAVFEAVEELFGLPLERKVKNVFEMPYFGYVGQLPDVPLYESFGIDNAHTRDGAESFTSLMWPDGNDHFCETINSYSKLVAELEQMVKRMVFESYGAEKSYESHDMGSTYYLLRATKYEGPHVDELSVGLTSHTDKSCITILHQNEVNGLEVKPRNGGEWIGFDPLPSSFVVVAGDAFLAWSNNRIHSPLHRVVMRGDKVRYSLGLFSLHKGIIQTPEELVDEEHPLQFKPFDNFGLLRYSYADVKTRSQCCVKEYCGV